MSEPARIGLSGWRWNNNLKSILLLAAFPVLLVALLGGIFYVFGLFTIPPPGGPQYFDPFASFGLQPVLGSGTAGDLALSAIYAWWPIMLGIAAVWVLVGYLFNDTIIHLATGATPVTREESPELYNLLENLCISRGLTTPKLYIIDTPAMNAYASGIDQKSYAITVTSGLLQVLNRDELETVLAHELTHIMDRDTRLLIIAIVFTGMISFIAQLLWRSLQVTTFARRRSRDGGGGVALMMVIAAVALAVGYVLALLLRFALSRRRELLADAGSVELTKNPDALISALLKISGNPDVPHVPSEVRQMFFENPPSAFDLGGLFGTHPTIEKRIEVLQGLGGRLPQSVEAQAAPPATGDARTRPADGQGDLPPGVKSPWE
jgi:heat shock protein HtpX